MDKQLNDFNVMQLTKDLLEKCITSKIELQIEIFSASTASPQNVTVFFVVQQTTFNNCFCWDFFWKYLAFYKHILQTHAQKSCNSRCLESAWVSAYYRTRTNTDTFSILYHSAIICHRDWCQKQTLVLKDVDKIYQHVKYVVRHNVSEEY